MLRRLSVFDKAILMHHVGASTRFSLARPATTLAHAAWVCVGKAQSRERSRRRRRLELTSPFTARLHSVCETDFETAASLVLSVCQNVYLHRVLRAAAYSSNRDTLEVKLWSKDFKSVQF